MSAYSDRSNILFPPSMAFLATPGTAGGYWDALDRYSIYSDSTLTTLAVVDGPVGAIRDKSGNGNHLIQPNATLRPTLRLWSDGRTYVEFDGINDALYASFAQVQPVSVATFLRFPDFSGVTEIIADGYFNATTGSPNTQNLLTRGTTTTPQTPTSRAITQASPTASLTNLNNNPSGNAFTAFQEYNGASSGSHDDDRPMLMVNSGTNAPQGVTLGRRAGYQNSGDLHAKFHFFGRVQMGRSFTTKERRQIFAFNEARRPTDITETIFTCGDSIMNTPLFADSVPEKLRQLLVTAGVTNKAIFNENVSTSRSHSAWAKAGAGPTTVAIAGNSLPAAVTPVALTIVTPLDIGGQSLSGPLALVSNTFVSGTLTTNNGTVVPGQMNVAGAGVYSFTRDVAGTTALDVSSGAVFTVNRHRRAKVKRIICTATNNTADARALTDIQALAAQGEAYIIGPTMSRTVASGSTAYIANRTLCSTLATQYGVRFLDYHAFARDTVNANGAWMMLGMTPDANNAADIAAGIMPRLFTYDDLHPNALFTGVTAQRLYNDLHAAPFNWF
jgi:hypothetical protein